MLEDIQINFVSGIELTRLRTASKSQTLAKAVGIRRGLRVLDATAGLGRDATFLAKVGAEVVALERNAVLAKKLQDALELAKMNESFTKLVLLPPQFLHQDFLDADLILPWEPDVIYLDPMYPHVEKSALPKGDIQTLRKALGPQSDIKAMLEKAMGLAQERVVVKRPHDVEPFLRPTHSFDSKLVRFDMYKVGT